MKRIIMLALLGLSLASGSVIAVDTAASPSAAAPKVSAVNARAKSLDEKGRYHAIHTKKEKLECTDCHGGGDEDILFLRTGEFQGKDGPVNRDVCLTCHQAPKKPTFYGVAK